MTNEALSADVAIVGGGITGLCAALTLSDAGANTIITDCGENAGSDSNAGSLHVQLQSRFLRLFPEQSLNVESSLPLYLRAVKCWDELHVRLHGVELDREGGIMVAEDDEQLEFLREKAERESRFGLDVEILDRNSLESIAPWIGPNCVGAELCRDEGKLNPFVANTKLRKWLSDQGVRFLSDRISDITSEQGVLLSDSGRRIRSDRTIIAAAWESRKLLDPLGCTMPTAWEALHMNITEPATYEIRHLVQHALHPITLKQFQSGQVVIGGGWPARFDPGRGCPEVLGGSMVGNLALAGNIVPGNLRTTGNEVLGGVKYCGGRKIDCWLNSRFSEYCCRHSG